MGRTKTGFMPLDVLDGRLLRYNNSLAPYGYQTV